MMRRIVLTIALVLTSLVISYESSHARSEESYRKDGIVIAMSDSWTPYSYQVAGGDPDGYLVDFWRKWSEKTGVPVSFEFMVWKDTINSVIEGRADIHGGLYSNDTRKAFFDFSEPIVNSSSVLVTKRGKNADCSSVVHNGPIGVIRGGNGEHYALIKYSDVPIVRFDSAREVVEAMWSERIAGAVMNYPALLAETQPMGITPGVRVCEFLFERSLKAGVKKGNTTLSEIVNWGIGMMSEQEREQLKRQWFVEPAVDVGWFSMVWPPALGVLLLTGVMIFFFRRWMR